MASKALVLLTTLGVYYVSQTLGWSTGGITGRILKAKASQNVKATDNDDNSSSQNQPLEAQRQQQQQQNNIIFEAMSIQGADKIAKMSIPERAKRAMLAEATEDRIFELAERLDGLFEDDGTVSVANREKAMDLTKQTKKLQMQYRDLVNGNPSNILQVLDEMGGDNKN